MVWLTPSRNCWGLLGGRGCRILSPGLVILKSCPVELVCTRAAFAHGPGGCSLQDLCSCLCGSMKQLSPAPSGRPLFPFSGSLEALAPGHPRMGLYSTDTKGQGVEGEFVVPSRALAASPWSLQDSTALRKCTDQQSQDLTPILGLQPTLCWLAFIEKLL